MAACRTHRLWVPNAPASHSHSLLVTCIRSFCREVEGEKPVQEFCSEQIEIRSWNAAPKPPRRQRKNRASSARIRLLYLDPRLLGLSRGRQLLNDISFPLAVLGPFEPVVRNR